MARHFLTLLDLSPAELHGLIERAMELKAMQREHHPHRPFEGHVMGMVFEKSSTGDSMCPAWRVSVLCPTDMTNRNN